MKLKIRTTCACTGSPNRVHFGTPLAYCTHLPSPTRLPFPHERRHPRRTAGHTSTPYGTTLAREVRWEKPRPTGVLPGGRETLSPVGRTAWRARASCAVVSLAPSTSLGCFPLPFYQSASSALGRCRRRRCACARTGDARRASRHTGRTTASSRRTQPRSTLVFGWLGGSSFATSTWTSRPGYRQDRPCQTLPRPNSLAFGHGSPASQHGSTVVPGVAARASQHGSMAAWDSQHGSMAAWASQHGSTGIGVWTSPLAMLSKAWHTTATVRRPQQVRPHRSMAA